MSIEEAWGNFFKAEIKASGFKLVAQEKISISSGTDTSIQAYVRVAPPFKVQLTATGIESPSFTAACTCPTAKKSQFCKHVWATLLAVEQRYPDFLSAKRVIEKPSHSEAKDNAKDKAKDKAAEYRKAQYERQKLRAKEIRRGARDRDASISRRAFPAEVEDALAYFAKNGFPMSTGPDEDVLGEAKRTLSRVFHPDKGGSHGEVVELNRYCELIMRFLKG
jgi:hypothetical protein